MGWKRIKEHYRINHIVQWSEGLLCIGSPYVPKLITITPDCDVAPSVLGLSSNDEISRYYHEMCADREKLKELLDAEDTFAASHTVYTYDGPKILEKQCETYGWPNLTHDGKLMYDNTFSPDRNKVVEWAISSAESEKRWTEEHVKELEVKYKAAQERAAQAQKDLQEAHALLLPTETT